MEFSIRPFEKKDAASLSALLSDAEVMRYLEPPYDREKADAFLEKAGLSDPPLIYAVDLADSSFAGYVIRHAYGADSTEIGWVLRKDLWGRGLASDLTARLIGMAGEAGKNVILECDPGQQASRRIAEKFGFSSIGSRGGCMVFLLIPRAGSRLSLIEPKFEDLRFRQAMLEDPATMSYNHAWGGTIPFPEEAWAGWYGHWVSGHEGKRFYRFLRTPDGSFAGEAAYHYDDTRRIWLADVIVYAPHRGKGYGGIALDLLCAAAKENGITCLYDDIAADNPALTLFLRHGFAEEYRTDEIVMLKKEL